MLERHQRPFLKARMPTGISPDFTDCAYEAHAQRIARVASVDEKQEDTECKQTDIDQVAKAEVGE